MLLRVAVMCCLLFVGVDNVCRLLFSIVAICCKVFVVVCWLLSGAVRCVAVVRCLSFVWWLLLVGNNLLLSGVRHLLFVDVRCLLLAVCC